MVIVRMVAPFDSIRGEMETSPKSQGSAPQLSSLVIAAMDYHSY